MSGYVNQVFRPDFTDYPAPPQNRLAPGFNAIWPASNPVGTETTQGMQSATPVDQIAFMRPDGTPVMQSDLARAHEQVQTAMQVAPTMVLGMMGTTDPAGIRAFHGSPYDFERFDTSRIGTGEGAQAYGHGLYFAEKEGTAQSYRDALTQKDFKTSTGEAVPDWIGNSVKQVGDQFGTDSPLYQQTIDRHIADFRGRKAETEQGMATDPQPWMARDRIAGFDNILQGLQNLKSGDATLLPRGRMYEVNIGADPEQFLHWDKPLSEQSPQVQQALGKLGIQPHDYAVRQTDAGYVVDYAGKTSDRVFKTADDAQRAADATATFQGKNPTGGQIYESSKLVPGNYRDTAAAAQALRDAGIPGIRYLDQGSRGAGEGTHNYVVFDAATIDILRKYGLAGLGIGLSGAAAGTQQQSQ